MFLNDLGKMQVYSNLKYKKRLINDISENKTLGNNLGFGRSMRDKITSSIPISMSSFDNSYLRQPMLHISQVSNYKHKAS